MNYTRLNPSIISQNYDSGWAVRSGNVTFTHTAPEGYTLLVNRPIAAFVSGSVKAYVTDRKALQSGTTVTVTVFVNNPENVSVGIGYSLLYVKG